MRLPEGDKESLPYLQQYNERPLIVQSPATAAEVLPFSAESKLGGPDMGSHIAPEDWEAGAYPEFSKTIYRAWLAALEDMKEKGIDVSSVPWFVPWLPWFAGPLISELKIERVTSDLAYVELLPIRDGKVLQWWPSSIAIEW